MAANPYKDLLNIIKSKEKAQTVGEQFVADLNRYFQLSKEVYVPSKTIKPSGLGGCLRQQWLILQGADRDVGVLEKAEDITIQQIGNDRHERLQNACQDAKNYGINIIWCDPEEEARLAQSKGINTVIKRRMGNELLCYNEDYNASFKCDGIIIYQDKKYILEIKTEEYGKFNCRYGPEPKHTYQAALYSLCFGINRIMFLYEDRNLTFRKGYEFIVTDQFKQTVKDRIELILAYDKTNIAPPKEKDKCTYCYYKQACKTYGNTNPYSLEELKQILEGDTNEQ